MRLPLGICLLLAACGPPEPVSSAPEVAPSTPPTAPRRFGELMAEVGHRFERVGRAGSAAQWDLAAYDLTELEEIFEGDVPTSLAPHDVPADVHGLARSFAQASLPSLAGAVRARDATAFASAFASTGAACNECHAATDHAFIVIPTTAGLPVPVIGVGEAP